jgi:hypothetical protein
MGAHRDVAGPLAAHLVDIASDRGPDTTSDDLSTAVTSSAHSLALECWRRGYIAAIADVRESHDAAFDDAPTGRYERPTAESCTQRATDDPDATPVRPISVAELKASRG